MEIHTKGLRHGSVNRKNAADCDWPSISNESKQPRNVRRHCRNVRRSSLETYLCRGRSLDVRERRGGLPAAGRPLRCFTPCVPAQGIQQQCRLRHFSEYSLFWDGGSFERVCPSAHHWRSDNVSLDDLCSRGLRARQGHWYVACDVDEIS